MPPGAAASKTARTKAGAESISIEESGVHKQASPESAAKPAETPTVATPTDPAGEESSSVDAGPEAESKPKSRWVPQIGVRAPDWRPVGIIRLVDRNVDYLWIGGLDLNRTLTVLRVRRYHLLRGCRQPAIRLGARAHALHRSHYIGLLSQKRIAKISSPAEIVAEQVHRIRKRHQRLDARVPILLPGRIHPLRSLKVAVSLKPLLCFGDLKRISARRQNLAEQWIGIQGDRCD